MSDLENLIGHFQVQNQQLQTLLMQKQALTIQVKEIEKALDYVESSKGDIYRTVGPLLVKSSSDDIKKQLEDEKEDIDIKLKSIEMQEKKMKDKLKESQEKIQSMMPSGQGG